MKAIILAFGRHDTLDPFTATRPAALIPVLNRPLLDHLVEGLQPAGWSEIVVLTGHLGGLIEEHLKGRAAGSAPVRCVPAADAAAADAALRGLLPADGEPALLVNGTVYGQPDLIRAAADAARRHARGSLQAMLGVNTNPLYHVKARVDAQGRVTGLQEVALADIKGSEQSPLPDVFAGAVILDEAALRALGSLEASRLDASLDGLLRAGLERGLPVAAVRADSPCVTLEYPWEILAASFLGLKLFFDRPAPIREIDPTARIDPAAILRGTVIVRKGAVVKAGAVLEDALVDEEAVILEHSYIHTAFVGRKCRVGPIGLVRRAVLGHGGGVGFPSEFPWAVSFGKGGLAHHGHAGMSVFGVGSGLSAGAITAANRGNPTKVKINGRLLDSGWFNLGAFVGDHTRINSGVTVMPGKKIGPHSIVGPGIVVYSDVPPRTKIVLRQELASEPI